MPRSQTPSFVLELPIVTTSADRRELNARFNAGMRLYNAVLGEAVKRLRASQAHPRWEEAKKMPKTVPAAKKGKTKANPERVALFALIHKETGWREFDLHSFATQTANASKWIADKVDSNTQQELATRAFKATERLIFGNAKSVRFKVPQRFRSMEGKSNKQGIRFKDDQFVWGKLQCRVLIDDTNPYHIHGLSSKIKFCRVIHKEVKYKQRWYLQLVLEGEPYANPKNFVGSGTVGIDLNISAIAAVGDDAAALLRFAPGVADISKAVAASQRKMARSDRVSNPTNYEPDFEGKRGRKTVKKQGKSKKKSKKTTYNKSNNYRKLSAKNRELNRRRTASATTANRQAVNTILRLGSHIKTENVSVKGWQKRYGKAIAAKSPGFVQSELKRKAESAGGSFTKFSTQTTALSQTHLDLTRTKKSLSERVHHDNSGKVMQRDLFSAFLARYVNDSLLPGDPQVLMTEYLRQESALLAAWECYKENSSSGAASPTPGDSQIPVEKNAENLVKLEQLFALGEENSKVKSLA
jgi:putative transposase